MTSSLETVMEETLTRPVAEMGIEMFSTFQVSVPTRPTTLCSLLTRRHLSACVSDNLTLTLTLR